MLKISVLTSLFNSDKYLEGYLSCIRQVKNLRDIEFIIIHNQPSENELRIISEFINKKNKVNIIHIIVKERENLYSSWNRGIKASKGKYIAIWNVDDIRLSDSLERQAKVLYENQNVYFTYGDQIEVKKYLDTEGLLIIQPEFEKNRDLFLNNYYGGCFPMWKKEVHDVIGYFDEQFKSAGDFDFFVRLARKFNGKKTEGILGYYLASTGISKTGRVNNIERTVIELRYAQFHKINFIFLLPAILNYSIGKMHWFNCVYRVSDYFDNYYYYWKKKLPLLLIGLIKFPFKFLIPTIIRYLFKGLSYAKYNSKF